ncbi:MAG: Caspase domain-containing protein [Leptolyngbyaceae cyanobacterium]|mgnify:CR=1 FL=1
MVKLRQSAAWGMFALCGAIATGFAVATLTTPSVSSISESVLEPDSPTVVSSRAGAPSFLVVAGGGAPSYNEIALEKNVRYFQRTLDHLGWDPAISTLFFANGNDGQATVRYIDRFGRERFKVPDITGLTGAATAPNVQTWLETYPQTPKGASTCPAFMYFTGHGALNDDNDDNNALILWEEELLSVQDLAQTLDQWPADIPFVTMMAQCYAGSFANVIYEQGDPTKAVALQSRCGFFATVKSRPSVGCTPLVNEADYRDYSSSFFAGLSGRDRLGHAVESADYDNNGTISFAEAHAFAKVDGETSDWPISTSEDWLQRQVTAAEQQSMLAQPMQRWLDAARPEQQYVIAALMDKLGYRPQEAFDTALAPKARLMSPPQEVLTAYYMRLRMELINVAVTQKLQIEGDETTLKTLNQLLDCEAGTW